MGRIAKSRIPWIVGSVIAALTLLLAAGCENDLQKYLFKQLFYDGWMIESWTAPAPLVDGQTHEVEDPVDLSNGFPAGVAIGDNGKIHAIGLRVSEHEWVYARKSPENERFDQSFAVIASNIRPGGVFTTMPHIDPAAGDSIMIAYSDEITDGATNDHLIFQQYVDGDGWQTEEDMYDPQGPDITQTFVFFMSSDYKPHLFYVSDGGLYHTVRTGWETINPALPEELVADVSLAEIERVGSNDLAILTADADGQNLYFTTLSGGGSEKIWSTTDPDVSIGHIDAAVDADGAVHVCFMTRSPLSPLDPALTTIQYLCNAGGTWREMGSIEGTEGSGPNPLMPISLAVVTDKYGTSRTHLVYTLYRPVNFYFWYAYYDENRWHVAEESLDTVNTNSMWTYGTVVADNEGSLHIVYSWAVNELDRTLMYIRGTPKEPQ